MAQQDVIGLDVGTSGSLGGICAIGTMADAAEPVTQMGNSNKKDSSDCDVLLADFLDLLSETKTTFLYTDMLRAGKTPADIVKQRCGGITFVTGQLRKALSFSFWKMTLYDEGVQVLHPDYPLVMASSCGEEVAARTGGRNVSMSISILYEYIIGRYYQKGKEVIAGRQGKEPSEVDDNTIDMVLTVPCMFRDIHRDWLESCTRVVKPHGPIRFVFEPFGGGIANLADTNVYSDVCTQLGVQRLESVRMTVIDIGAGSTDFAQVDVNEAYKLVDFDPVNPPQALPCNPRSVAVGAADVEKSALELILKNLEGVYQRLQERAAEREGEGKATDADRHLLATPYPGVASSTKRVLLKGLEESKELFLAGNVTQEVARQKSYAVCKPTDIKFNVPKEAKILGKELRQAINDLKDSPGSMLESSVSTVAQISGIKLGGFIEAVLQNICEQFRRYLEARKIYGGLCAIVGGMTASPIVRDRVEKVFRGVCGARGGEPLLVKALSMGVQHCVCMGAVRAAGAGVAHDLTELPITENIIILPGFSSEEQEIRLSIARAATPATCLSRQAEKLFGAIDAEAATKDPSDNEINKTLGDLLAQVERADTYEDAQPVVQIDRGTRSKQSLYVRPCYAKSFTVLIFVAKYSGGVLGNPKNCCVVNVDMGRMVIGFRTMMVDKFSNEELEQAALALGMAKGASRAEVKRLAATIPITDEEIREWYGRAYDVTLLPPEENIAVTVQDAYRAKDMKLHIAPVESTDQPTVYYDLPLTGFKM